MHWTRCTLIDVLHSDVLHSVYYALDSDVLHFVYYTLCTMLCTLDSACIVLCVLDPMYFSKGLRKEEPFAMLSGEKERPRLLAARSDLWEVVGGGEKGGLLVRRGAMAVELS